MPATATSSEFSTLRININGIWSALEFKQLFEAVNTFYEIGTVQSLIRPMSREIYLGYATIPLDDPNFFRLASSNWRLLFGGPNVPVMPEGDFAGLRLRVQAIRFESPGFSDLFGIGKVIKEVKDLIVSLLEARHKARMNHEDLVSARLRNDALRLQNAEKFLKVAKEAGWPAEDFARTVVAISELQDPLQALIEKGKITSAEEKDE